jgi:hypothetical protein
MNSSDENIQEISGKDNSYCKKNFYNLEVRNLGQIDKGS